MFRTDLSSTRAKVNRRYHRSTCELLFKVPVTKARPPAIDVDAESAGPRSPLRSLGILHRLALQTKGLTLSELSSEVGAPKTSVLALLRALHQGGYVALQGSRYVLGDASYMLSSLIMARKRPSDVRHLPEIAQPFLRSLAEKSGETVFVSALAPDSMEAVYIARAESANPIRFMASIGERRPLYSSAGGRTLLAFMSRDEQERYLKPLKPVSFTQKTLVDKRQIRRMLDEIRTTGIASTSDDTHIGVSAFGMPLYAQGGDVVAALVLAAPTDRVAPQSARMITLLREHGQALSRAMGHVAG